MAEALTKIDEDAKETIRPYNGDRQEQAGPHSAVSAVPFFDKHQTVGSIDGVQLTEAKRFDGVVRRAPWCEAFSAQIDADATRGSLRRNRWPNPENVVALCR